jgi:hypothetical protein
MSKHRHDYKESRGPTTSRKVKGMMAPIGLLAGAVLCVAIFVWPPSSRRVPAPTPAKPAGGTSTNAAAAETPAKTSLDKLLGKWLRPDGGYILHIKQVGADGKLDVAYLNPNPIHVSRAEATSDGNSMKVFIELRDAGYPGCTYQLVYLPRDDQLRGTYFQAAIRENFEVVFSRVK